MSVWLTFKLISLYMLYSCSLWLTVLVTNHFKTQVWRGMNLLCCKVWRMWSYFWYIYLYIYSHWLSFVCLRFSKKNWFKVPSFLSALSSLCFLSLSLPLYVPSPPQFTPISLTSLFDTITSLWQQQTKPLILFLMKWMVTGMVTTQICADITLVMEYAAARSATAPHPLRLIAISDPITQSEQPHRRDLASLSLATTNELDYNASTGGLVWQMDRRWMLPTRLSYKSSLKSKIFGLIYKLYTAYCLLRFKHVTAFWLCYLGTEESIRCLCSLEAFCEYTQWWNIYVMT